MSSVSSSGASRIVPTERPLPVGRITADNSSDAPFAVQPAANPQDADPDASQPTDPVAITIDATRVAATNAQPEPAAGYAAALSAAHAAALPPRAEAVNAAIPLALASYNGTAASLAAYAYAQMRQAWLESKSPRPAPARQPARPKAHTER